MGLEKGKGVRERWSGVRGRGGGGVGERKGCEGKVEWG